MTDKHKVLEKLFTDDNDINANELYDLLSPFIKINKTNKSIIFLDSNKQSLKNKIILFLLAKKVLFLLEQIETDHIKPKDIIKETGISKGSVLPTLKLLKEAKNGSLISTDVDGCYITSYQVSKIKTKNILSNYEKDK
jgi:DNA-binding MarR family transcriptional regulator